MTRGDRPRSPTHDPARRTWRRVRRRLRRAVLARRRTLAAVSAALAVLLTVRAGAAPPPPTVAVLTAARDLPAGAVLTAADLARVPFRPGSVPSGALRGPGAAVGRTTTGPVRGGEPLTDTRLLGAGLLQGYPGLVAAPVRIGDAGAARLLRPGDRITLIAADPQGQVEPVEVARDVPVVTVPRAGRSAAAGLTGGALVVVAVPPATARVLAGHAVASFLSAVVVR